MDNNKKQSEYITQHLKDANKTLDDLETRCNISGGTSSWEEIVKARTKHVSNFIKALEKQEAEFEHFK